LGANAGKAGTAADRGSESLVQGFVDVTSGASAVTLDGFRFEKDPNTLYWNGTNVRMLAPTSTLTNSIIEAGSAANYPNSGNTATLEGAVSTVTNNLFLNALNPGQQPNLLSVRNTTSGITTATITGNTFTQTGTTDNVSSIALVGQYGTVTIQDNTITGGGDGIFHYGLPSGGTIDTLTVQGNTITNVGKNGLFLAGWDQGYYSIVNGGSVTGNAITGSGQSGSDFANIYIRPGNTVHTSFTVSNNDLSRVAGSNKSVESGVILNAENNWWGSASGPSHLSNPNGTGAAVSGNVDFDPWIGKTENDSGTATIPPNTPQWLFEAIVADAAANEETVSTTVDTDQLNDLLAMVEALPAQDDPVTIVVNLAAGTYGGLNLNIPNNVTLVIDGQGGAVTITGSSPALTVNAGDTIVQDGVTLVTTTDDPTVLVTGGSLTVRNSTITETTNGDQAAIEIQGGTVDLGLTGDPGNNVFNIQGAGQLIKNTGANPVSAIGNTWQQDGSAITSNFSIEDAITHALDDATYGLVTWVANNLYVTEDSGSIQRGINAATPTNTRQRRRG
jgi:hypothetical protein